MSIACVNYDESKRIDAATLPKFQNGSRCPSCGCTRARVCYSPGRAFATAALPTGNPSKRLGWVRDGFRCYRAGRAALPGPRAPGTLPQLLAERIRGDPVSELARGDPYASRVRLVPTMR